MDTMDQSSYDALSPVSKVEIELILAYINGEERGWKAHRDNYLGRSLNNREEDFLTALNYLFDNHNINVPKIDRKTELRYTLDTNSYTPEYIENLKNLMKKFGFMEKQFENYYKHILLVIEQAKNSKDVHVDISEKFGRGERIRLSYKGFNEVFEVMRIGKNYLMIPYDVGIDVMPGQWYDTRARPFITEGQYSILMEKLRELEKNQIQRRS